MVPTAHRLTMLLRGGLLTACLLAGSLLPGAAAAQGGDLGQLEIDVDEIEEAQEQYKPTPPITDIHRLDLTDTLPDAVLEPMIGASPHDFVDAVWGLEVTGDWPERQTGTGTLQVFNYTEGLGASGEIDRDRFTGEMGMRLYSAVLDKPGTQEFRLSAAFPAEAGGLTPDTDPNSNFDEAKSVFFVNTCHMFEPGRTGCTQTPRPDEYYTTQQPILEKMHIDVRGTSYKITFLARVEEIRHYLDQNDRRRRELTGRVGEIEGWVCDKASWENDPDSCTQDEPLRVVENTPENEHENVNFVTPGIGWEFNEPVSTASLKENFTVITKDASGDSIEVPGTVIDEGSNRFSFQPEAPLESGVMYEARIVGGPDGLRARSGDIRLAADHWWRFTTLIDLENHADLSPDFSSQMGSASAGEEPIEVHVFQTVRDAPLVMGKPAMARIYVNWEAHEHIHPDWQPTSYEAEIDLDVDSPQNWRVNPQRGGWVDGDVVSVVRPDQFTDGVRRQAGHTINVFGWTPQETGGTSTLEARLRPHDPYPRPLEPQDVIGEREVAHWYADPAPLVFRYTFLKAGSWKDGVPDADRGKAERAVRLAEAFAVQTMPVKEAHGIYVNRDTDRDDTNSNRSAVIAAIEAAVIAAELEADLRDWYAESYPDSPIDTVWADESLIGSFLAEDGRETVNLEAFKNTIQIVREDVMEFVGSPDDIVVVFYPSDFLGFGRNTNSGLIHDPRRGVGMPIADFLSADVTAMGLVHEFGHYFGLDHRPQSGLKRSAVAGDVDMTIEGFRLSPDGMSGANKSGIEGNAEVANILLPLMWPGVEERNKAWVNNDDYQILMRSLGPASVLDQQ